jgi:retinal rod rhodopsin-sensitive cGMP 3',5'-cyclic phosphodiesterase subunit delta
MEPKISTSRSSSKDESVCKLMGKMGLEDEDACGGAKAQRADSKEETYDPVWKDRLRIIWMNMRDASTGKLIWKSSDSHGDTLFDQEVSENVPASILKCSAVSREIHFSCSTQLSNFRIVQRVMLNGQLIEQWDFFFGFVIAGSTNTWQQVIEAAGENLMLPVHVLSGNAVFETLFYDGDEFLCRARVRIFYV